MSTIPPAADQLDARIGRASAGLATLRERGLLDRPLRPPLSHAEVGAFEARHGVALPPEYRAFLMRIGNGGAGPAHGLVPLERSVEDYGIELGEDFLRTPFRHERAYDPERDPEWDALLHRADLGEIAEEEVDRLDRYQVAGTLLLCDEGCGYLHRLVITGPARGGVWMDARGGVGGLIPFGVDFLEWYQRWLDNRLRGGQGTSWMDAAGGW